MQKTKKNLIKSMILVLAIVLFLPTAAPVRALAAGKGMEVRAKGVKLSKNKGTLAQGKTAQLTVNYQGKNVTAKASYRSDKPGVVSVSKKGKLRAKKAGNCVITIKYKKSVKKWKLTVKKKAGHVKETYPVGNYSYVAMAGGYRGSLQVSASGKATITEWGSATPEGTKTIYQMTRDKKAKAGKGVKVYRLKCVRRYEVRADKNFKVTGRLSRTGDKTMRYDTRKKEWKDEYGAKWERV